MFRPRAWRHMLFKDGSYVSYDQMWEWDHLSTPLLVILNPFRWTCVCVCVCVVERHHHNSSLWAHLQVLTVPSPKGISPTLKPSFSREQGSIFLFYHLFALSLPLSLLPPNNSIQFRAWLQTLTVALNVLNSIYKKKTAIAIHARIPFQYILVS